VRHHSRRRVRHLARRRPRTSRATRYDLRAIYVPGNGTTVAVFVWRVCVCKRNARRRRRRLSRPRQQRSWARARGFTCTSYVVPLGEISSDEFVSRFSNGYERYVIRSKRNSRGIPRLKRCDIGTVKRGKACVIPGYYDEIILRRIRNHVRAWFRTRSYNRLRTLA